MPNPHQLFLTGFGLSNAIVAGAESIDKVGLFQNQPTLERDFDPLSLSECDFSGYARIDITGTWGGLVIDTDGNAVMTAPLIAWTKSGGTPNDAVYGLIFYDAADEVLGAQYFNDGPYRMSVDGDLIRLTPTAMAGNPLIVQSNASNP